MKRILSIALTLIMLLAALTGCMASQKPAGNEGEQNPSGKRLPIKMTIAETLPSCVAFEYKDEKPYCFYAFDDDGKLYRVLWNNFDGLNEKDRIVVDHNDNIVALNYDEYPSGWTPQYEITAISIYSEEEWNDIIESTSPAEYFQIQKNDNGIIVFSVVAGFPQAKYTYKDNDADEYVGRNLNNETGEINGLLFDLLNGKSTVSDEKSNTFTHSVSMTCSYTSDDGSGEISIVYEFKWSSANNTMTIFKDNTLMGTVLLSDDEMSAFKNNLNNVK